MSRYTLGIFFSFVFIFSPGVTKAASLTEHQATSLVAVVQAAPSVPASAFVIS